MRSSFSVVLFGTLTLALAGCPHAPVSGADGGMLTNDGGQPVADGGGSVDGGGGGRSEPLANLCADQQQLSCELYVCSFIAALGGVGTNNPPGFLASGCVVNDGGCAETTATYVAGVGAGRLTYDGAKAATCLAWLGAAASCEKNVTCQPAEADAGSQPIECATMLVGNVAATGACYADVECQSGLYCAFGAGQCPGKCSPMVAANQPCDLTVECVANATCTAIADAGSGCLVPPPNAATGGDCQVANCVANDYCATTDGGASSCAPDAPAGGGCGTQSSPACLPIDECRGATAPTCQSCPSGVGSPCEQAVTSGDNCPAGTFCQATVTGGNPAVGSCATLLANGSACTLDLACTPPAVCLGSTAPGTAGSCGLPYPDGHACLRPTDCNSGSCLGGACLGEGQDAGVVCDPNASTPCAGLLWCNVGDGGAGTCEAPAGQGQPCNPATCGNGLICLTTQTGDAGPSSLCGSPFATGQACGQDTDCASGYCSTPDGGASICAAVIADGQPCDQDSHCESGHCTLGYCLRCVGR